MDWIITITGDEIDLRELAKVWNKPELTIEKENDSYILKSSDFIPLTSDREVQEKATAFLQPINAGIKIVLGGDIPLKAGNPTQIMPDGTRMAYISAHMNMKMRCFASISLIKSDGTVENENPADPIVSLYSLAQSDPQVAKVCQYLNLDLNSWFPLYCIIEILMEDGFKAIKNGGIHKKKADNFKHTANSYQILGVKSRHAKDKKEIPPSNPMTLSEAQEFIKILIREWLDEKRKK